MADAALAPETGLPLLRYINNSYTRTPALRKTGIFLTIMRHGMMPAPQALAYITAGNAFRRCWREKKVHSSSVASGPSGAL